MRDLWDGTGGSGSGDGENGGPEGSDGGRADGGAAASSSGATPAMLAAARARYMPYSSAQREALRAQVLQFLLAGGSGGEAGGSGAGGAGGGDAGFALASLGIDSTRRLREVLRACQVGVGVGCVQLEGAGSSSLSAAGLNARGLWEVLLHRQDPFSKVAEEF